MIRAPRLRITPSQRRILGELAIVVTGVFIALLAEQAVQSLNWQSQVREARKALQAELAYNVGGYDIRVSQSPCVARRLDELQRWVDGWQDGSGRVLNGPIGRIYGFSMYDSVWNIVQGGQVATHIPIADRLEYARMYDNLENYSQMQEKEYAVWALLRGYEGARALDPGDIVQIKAALAQARLFDKVIRENGPGYIWSSAASLDIEPERPPLPGPADEMCRPLVLRASA